LFAFILKIVKNAVVAGFLLAILPVNASRHKESGNPYYIYTSEYAKLRHKAQLGDPNALFVLGNYYYKPPQGTIFKKNFRKSVEFYFKAGLRGNPAAQYNYAFMLSRGQGIAKNLLESYIWFRLAEQNESIVGKHINDLSKIAVDSIGKQLTKVQKVLAEKKIQFYAKAISEKRYNRIKFASQKNN